MAILTYPLNGILYDAEDVETYLCTRTSGVFASDGHFPASVTGSRQVTIGPGLAWMNNEEYHGKAIYNPENVALEIAEADAYQTRIDRIVLRFDKLLNKTDLMVLQGEPGQGAPDIERDSLVYDLGLYTVTVKNSTASVSASDISSTMLDESVCGIMEDAVTSIPTQQLYDQWYSWFEGMQTDTEAFEEQFNLWFEQIKIEADEYMTETKNDFEVWMNGTKVDFDTWFDSIQDTLDGDTAGKLTNLVNDAQDTADEALEQLITGVVTGFMTEEYTGGEYGLLADDSDDSHAITLSKNICDCEGNTSADMSMISDEFNESYTYKEGDYCIYENTLFVFTADKSAGAWDWSCVKATSVGTELSNTNEKINGLADITQYTVSLADSGDITFRSTAILEFFKCGEIVECRAFLVGGISTASTWITIGTIPEEYRPIHQVSVLGIAQASTFTRTIFEINTNGTIQVYSYATISDSGTAFFVRDNITYFAGDAEDMPNISPSSTDDDGDTKTAPGPEIIDPDDDGNDNPDDNGDDDDDTKTAPGPEIIEPDDDEPDDTGDDEPDDDDNGDDDEPVVGPGPEEVE